MYVIDKLKQNAISSRRGEKISVLARMREDILLKKISKIICNFMNVSFDFGYDFNTKENGFFTCIEHLVEEAKSSSNWKESTYTANAMGAAYFFAFLIIDNYPNSFNFKEVRGHYPHLDYVGDAVDMDISFNLAQTMYDILKCNRDISKLNTIYNLCDALYNGTVSEATIGQYIDN